MSTFWYDLRHAVRTLVRQPVFSTVTLLTLTLGVGATTAIFSLLHAVLLSPLPYPDGDRLVRVWGWAPERGRDQERLLVSYPRWEMIRERADVFQEAGATAYAGFTLTGQGEPDLLEGSYASARFFQTLGVTMARGRPFLPQEERPGAEPVVVVSWSCWQQRFGGSPTLLGRPLTFDGIPRTVVGILAAPLAFPYDRTEVFVPGVTELPGVPAAAARRGMASLEITARLRAGVTLGRADEALRLLAAHYREVFPDHVDVGYGLKATSFRDGLVAGARPTLYMLAATAGCILLIACVNVANLLLARLSGRRQEIAVRATLGATRLRLARQFLTESLVLTLSAGAAGTLLAWWCVVLVHRLGSDVVPRAEEVRLDGTTLLFTLGVALVCGCLLGVVPALQYMGRKPSDALRQADSRGATGGVRHGQVQAGLLVAQVALSLVLLTSTGLLLGSLWRLLHVRPGFNPEGVLVADVTLPAQRYPQPDQQAGFFARLTARLDGLPGVRRAAVGSGGPLLGYNRFFYAVVGRPVPPLQARPSANCCFVSPGFFATLGIPVLRGRAFDERDRAGQSPVMMINETMAKQLFPGAEAVGQKLLCTTTNPTVTEIVGVVGDARTISLAQPAAPEMYFSVFQRASLAMRVLVKAARPGQTRSLGAALRAAVTAVDSDQPTAHLTEMNQIVSDSLADRQIVALLLGGFAGLALVLAAVGIYGVAAYAVVQRTREIGIRIALGARRDDVFRLVIGGGMKLLLAGILVGLATAFGVTRLLVSLLYDVGATDPLTFAAVVGVLTLVALLANYLPARRATRIDPLSCLREQ